MTKQKHTQGPWKIDPCLDIIGNTNEGNGVVCAVVHDGVEDPDEAKANARLIAAAPDLLEALQDARTQCVAWQGEVNEFSCDIHREIMNKIDSAISKATGEQPQ